MGAGSRRALGAAGEAAAEDALRRAGYAVLARNLRTPLAEIDLLAEQNGCLCVIEVKTRTGEGYGHPAETVTASQQSRLRRAAAFLLQDPRYRDAQIRFDVVAVLEEGGALRAEIIPDAFR